MEISAEQGRTGTTERSVGNRMEKAKRVLESETFRYFVFGALTVLVNIAAFKLLDLVCSTLFANTLAFFLAVLFAYWTNSTFVFRAPHTWKNFLQFLGMRAGTLLIDDGGLLLLLHLGSGDLLAKCITNAVVIAVNYIVSKLIIFRDKKGDHEGSQKR